jgi:hypothetical protein
MSREVRFTDDMIPSVPPGHDEACCPGAVEGYGAEGAFYKGLGKGVYEVVR